MKTSKILFGLVAMFVVALAVAFPNEAMALAGHINASDLTDGPVMGMAGLVSLANLSADSEGKPNPGGTRKLFIIHKKGIVGVWPKQVDIVAGEIATGPTLVAGAGFAQYEFPDGTFTITDSQEGDAGFMSFKHMTGFMLAGFGKEIVAEVLKHLNAGSVIIGQLNDDQYFVAGSSDNPLYIKSGFGSGGKGSDKRGYTCKGEQDGFMWGIMPLKSTLVATLPLLPLPV